MADPTLHAPASYRRAPWKNGGGVTTTIAEVRLADVAADDWSGVIWQFGRTRIAAPGPFSDLAGFDRLQVVVAGRGLLLRTADGDIDLRYPFAVVGYDGGVPIVSVLEDGPVEVVNLISRRALCGADLVVLSAGAERPLAAARHVVYAPAAAADVRVSGRGFRVPHDHALRFDGATAVECLSGTALVASIAML